MRERKDVLLLEAKALHEGAGFLEGYASIKNEVDAYGDIIADGAYANLASFIQNGFCPVGHEWGETPIGFIADAREDHRGLWVRIAFHSTKTAQEARTVAQERLSAGKTVGLSIGYYVLDYEMKGGNRVLKSIEIAEASLVNAPAAKNAQAVSVRSAGRSYQDQLDALLADAKALVTRTADIKAMRIREGRSLSSEKQSQVHDFLAALDSVRNAASQLADQTQSVPESELIELSQMAARWL